MRRVSQKLALSGIAAFPIHLLAVPVTGFVSMGAYAGVVPCYTVSVVLRFPGCHVSDNR